MLDKIEAFAEKHHMFPSEGTILAAVSGGADSVCLLAALLELKDKFGFSVLGGEEAARRLRYDFFYETGKKSGAVRIATAHTADDNAETILFHLTRGAGLRGLGGIPPVHGHIIRPMLAVTREEVLFFLSGRSLTYVEDSSNADEKYSRNLIRRRVIPVLKQIGRASCRERVCQYV
jgi:tRNA(Ile)-lysidine synthase